MNHWRRWREWGTERERITLVPQPYCPAVNVACVGSEAMKHVLKVECACVCVARNSSRTLRMLQAGRSRVLFPIPMYK
jgi:hypothetical protein